MPRQGDEPVPGYRLQKRLGRGSFGEVWKASGPGGTLAALKFIALGDNQALREFRAIQRIKQVRHVHLMPLIGIWLIDQHEQIMDEEFLAKWSNSPPPPPPPGPSDSRGTLQLPPADQRRPVELIEAMPLGDQDLFGRLADCKSAGLEGIPPAELLGYLEDAAKAIDFLNSQRHDLGSGPVAIHHGDIKPQNIMLVGGSAQVCDFGLARLLGGAHATSTALAGSPAYMAPESIRDKQPHRATDQYSLAITYAELRTGLLPFHTQSYMEILHAHLDGKLNLDLLPPAERAVLQRATALDPNDRYPTSLEMVHELQRAVATTPPPLAAARGEIPAPPIMRGRKSDVQQQPRGTLVPEAARSASASDVTLAPVTATPRDRLVRETEPHAPLLASIVEPPLPVKSGSKRFIGALAGLILVAACGLGAWQYRHFPIGVKTSSSGDGSNVVAATPEVVPETTPPENGLPTIAVTGIEPAEPQAGGPLDLQLEGSDPEGESLLYEYRTSSDADWLTATDGRVHVDKLQPGELVLELRASDEAGATSEILTRRWQIASPDLPKITNVKAPETLMAGESLSVVLTGSDPAGGKLTFRSRRVPDGAWEDISGNEFTLANVEPGKLQLEFSAVNDAQLESAVVLQQWDVKKEYENALKMKLRYIPAGTFSMGSHESTAEIQVAFAIPEELRNTPWANYDDEVPSHEVTITRPFYLGTHEVTKGEFAEFVSATKYKTDAERDDVGGWGWDPVKKSLERLPEYNWKNWGVDQADNSPVVNVNWNDAVKFCEWLSTRDGRAYRLPTEAEWEYACRAGTTTRFWSGDDPRSLASIANVPDEKALAEIPEVTMSIAADDGHAFIAPVGSYDANPWGLYDMHGNAWEWCADWHASDYYQKREGTDPKGPQDGENRISRGGGWLPLPVCCRSSYRGYSPPVYCSHFTGFRVAMDVP